MNLWNFKKIFRLKQLPQIYVLCLRHTALSLQWFAKHSVSFFSSSSHWTLHPQLLTSSLLRRCFLLLCQLSAKLRGLSILFQNNSWLPIVQLSLHIKPLQSMSFSSAHSWSLFFYNFYNFPYRSLRRRYLCNLSPVENSALFQALSTTFRLKLIQVLETILGGVTFWIYMTSHGTDFTPDDTKIIFIVLLSSDSSLTLQNIRYYRLRVDINSNKLYI